MAAPVGSDLMPWEHATSGLCCTAAEEWLRAQERSVKRVWIVEWWAVFYESHAGEARHQRWEINDKQKLVLAGPHKDGWPVLA